MKDLRLENITKANQSKKAHDWSQPTQKFCKAVFKVKVHYSLGRGLCLSLPLLFGPIINQILKPNVLCFEFNYTYRFFFFLN